MRRPTLVTGYGVCSGAGPSNEDFARGLREGGGTFTPLLEPLNQLQPGFGGVATSDRKLLRQLPGTRALRPSTMTRYTYLSTVGIGLAMADADVAPDPEPDEAIRRSLFIGSYVNLPEMHKQVGMSYMVRDEAAAADGEFRIDDSKVMQGMRRFTGFEFLRLMNNMPVGHGAIQLQARGPCNTFMGFCTAGLQALGTGLRTIQDEYADLALCGGAGSCVVEHSLMYKGYRGLISTGDDPLTACQPFGDGATGIVPGEGAAYMALEAEETARNRSATPIARFLGYATGFAPPRESRGYPADPANLVGTMAAALDDAGLAPADIDLLVPTGYGLPAMDALEVAAWRELFGDHLDHIQVLPYTPVTGFCEASHGTLGVAAAVTAMQAVQPIVPWRPASPIEGYPAAVSPARPQRALVASMAMEGTAAAVVLQRFSS